MALIRYDVQFVLPMPTMKIVGGYKVVYQYANYLTQKGYKVCITYDAKRGRNSSRVPRLACLLLRKLIGNFGPCWYKLDESVARTTVYTLNSDTIHSKVVIATTPEISHFVNSLDKHICKIYFIQGYEDWYINEARLVETYRFGMHIITVSLWLKQLVGMYAQYPVKCVPNGIDDNVFRIKVSPENRKLHTIAMLYHEDKKKGFDIAMAVLKMLHKRYDDLQVFLFGSPKPDKCWPNWISYSRNATEDDVCNIMNSSTVYLCTSRVEGFGLTGLESLYCGCCLVTTNTKGAMEYCYNENALVCEVDDVSDIYHSVIRVFESRDLRNKLIENCIPILKKFDLCESSKSFLNCIKEYAIIDKG